MKYKITPTASLVRGFQIKITNNFWWIFSKESFSCGQSANNTQVSLGIVVVINNLQNEYQVWDEVLEEVTFKGFKSPQFILEVDLLWISSILTHQNHILGIWIFLKNMSLLNFDVLSLEVIWWEMLRCLWPLVVFMIDELNMLFILFLPLFVPVFRTCLSFILREAVWGDFRNDITKLKMLSPNHTYSSDTKCDSNELSCRTLVTNCSRVTKITFRLVFEMWKIAVIIVDRKNFSISKICWCQRKLCTKCKQRPASHIIDNKPTLYRKAFPLYFFPYSFRKIFSCLMSTKISEFFSVGNRHFGLTRNCLLVKTVKKAPLFLYTKEMNER